MLTRGPGFQVKRLSIKPDCRLSYQWHRHRAETWTVARGIARVTINGEDQMLGPSQSIHVPRTHKHRIANPSSIEPLEIIEVQTGDYLGEDDIVRETMISGGREPRAWRLVVVEYVADRSGSDQLSPIRVR